MAEADPEVAEVPVANRPGIIFIGSPNVGKRTLLSHLLSDDIEDDALESTDAISCHGWTIDTKYYSADVLIWTAQLDGSFSSSQLPTPQQLVALVLVFDLNDLSSFTALQDLVSSININHFEVLLCIGNKADLLPGHYAHVEYRRHLQKRGEFSSDPHSEPKYGILETEGTSLLCEEESSWEIRNSCLEWCMQHNIEYVEACGSNPVFDKFLSRDGDVQGVDRLYGALTAHMWPGMVLKSGIRVAEPFPLKREVKIEESDDSEYEVEYELLPGAFEEPQDDNSEAWVAFGDQRANSSNEEATSTAQKPEAGDVIMHQVSIFNPTFSPVFAGCDVHQHRVVEEPSALGNPLVTAGKEEHTDVDESFTECGEVGGDLEGTSNFTEREPEQSMPLVDVDGDTHLEYDNLEHLMSEIGSMRGSLRLMPDFQRREMAAMLAMKMAVMFGCSSDEEGFE